MSKKKKPEPAMPEVDEIYATAAEIEAMTERIKKKENLAAVAAELQSLLKHISENWACHLTPARKIELELRKRQREAEVTDVNGFVYATYQMAREHPEFLPPGLTVEKMKNNIERKEALTFLMMTQNQLLEVLGEQMEAARERLLAAGFVVDE